MCDVWGVCMCMCFLLLPLYTSTHLPASMWVSFYICMSYWNPPKFSMLKHKILVQNGPSMSSHISLFKQCLTDRTSPEKHKVFLLTSFVFLEFWNHVYTTVQGLSYITITAGFPTRWKLKEYGCRQLRLMHWWNDSGSWSDILYEETPGREGILLLPS